MLAPDALSVTQTRNAVPSFFIGDFPAQGRLIEATVEVTTERDNDFIGFALGFEPGDTEDTSASYLLVDWRKEDQFAPAIEEDPCFPEALLEEGMAVSLVTGNATQRELSDHADHDVPCSPLGTGVEELARANNFGDVGWDTFTTYTFRFEFTETSLKVWVDGVLELSVTGDFDPGRFAFYNFSQEDAIYTLQSVEALEREVQIDVKPGSDPNSINSKSRGVIPVSILSGEDLDAPTQVDRASLTFGATGDEDSLQTRGGSQHPVPNCGAEDIDGDGLVDLVCHFETQDTALSKGDTEATLRGELTNGTPIVGIDSVRIVR